jgi:DNA-binding transcriptional ArsR family regulator
MNESYEDINERVREEWTEGTDGFDRVRDVMRNATESMTASEVAEIAEVSPNTARKYLNRLVEMSRVHTEKSGKTTLYRWDESAEKMDRVRSLSRKHSKEEIEDSIREMRAKIHDYREEYGCEEPEDLVVGMDEGEGSEVWNTVSDWKTTRRNLAVAKTALAFKQVLTHSEDEEVQSEGVPS